MRQRVGGRARSCRRQSADPRGGCALDPGPRAEYPQQRLDLRKRNAVPLAVCAIAFVPIEPRNRLFVHLYRMYECTYKCKVCRAALHRPRLAPATITIAGVFGSVSPLQSKHSVTVCKKLRQRSGHDVMAAPDGGRGQGAATKIPGPLEGLAAATSLVTLRKSL